ncbi:MAG: ABC transporter permease subunit [Chloroflexota bacterium]|nr:ABC transporter permease subunit [Chloroflexota bacterium]
MIRYLVLRLAWSVAVLFGLSVLFFALEQFTPNGPCAALHSYAPGAQRAVVKCATQFGSGQQPPVQYLRVMARYVHGDWGPLASTQSFDRFLAVRLPGDVLFFLGAVFIQVPLAIALGTAAAVWQRSWVGRVFTPLAVLARAVPPFWLAVMLFWLVPVLFVYPEGALSVDVGAPRSSALPFFWSRAWFAALGRHPGAVLGQLLPILLQMLIPVVAIGTLVSALAIRDVVSATLREPHVSVARAAGLSRGVVFRRALGASRAAVMASLTGQFAALLGAMALVEYALHWPGSLGIFFYAGPNGDPATTQGLFIVVALVALAGGLLSSVLQGIFDPRLRDGATSLVPDTSFRVTPPIGPLEKRLWFVVSIALLSVLICAAIFAPAISPESFTGYDYTVGMTSPHLAWPWQHQWRYLLGSDGGSHSMLMWVTYGARIPLAVSLLATLIATAIVLLVHSLSALPGALGTWAEALVRWTTAVLTTAPAFLLLFMLSAYLAQGRWVVIALLLGLIGWPNIVRSVHSPSMTYRRREAVLFSRAIGISTVALIWRGFQPLLGPLVNGAFRFAAAAIALDATLDFMQVGILPATNPTWGNAFALNPSYFFGNAWWVPLFPGLCVVLASLALVGVGEGLHRLLGSPRVSREARRLWIFRRSRERMHEDVMTPITARQDSFNSLGSPAQDGRS